MLTFSYQLKSFESNLVNFKHMYILHEYQFVVICFEQRNLYVYIWKVERILHNVLCGSAIKTLTGDSS